ncbi:glycosyltransferase family 2 protein [Pseudofrancisella aestuarii]|uniref:Glycosyltransferase family 2 protein n=1 Tax=Pseudofrancisella aestuarii TaxID=2670347 RepID=A0ABV9TAD1_9GAMM|nr:glycosyltransferase family 2 protein [Pseudofrancisella aestuarii]
MLNKEIRPEILLSIIIPHYKTYELLIKLLKTIPDKPSIEVIIVDDLSNDSRLKSLEGFFENVKFNLILNDYHSNAGHCRNVGLSLASGKWLFFADSDDFFLDNLYDNISCYFNSDNDVVYYYPASKNEHGEQGARHLIYEKIFNSYVKNPNEINLLSLRFKTHAVWAKLIKRQLILDNEIKFDEIAFANDVMFSTRVGLHMKKFAFAPEKIYCVTRRYGSLTVTLSRESLLIRMYALINQYNFLKNKVTIHKMKQINISGLHIFMKSLRCSICFGIKVYIIFRKNNIPVFRKMTFIEYCDVKYLVKKIIAFKNDAKYEVKK